MSRFICRKHLKPNPSQCLTCIFAAHANAEKEQVAVCRWCKQDIYEGVKEGRKRVFAHILTGQIPCQKGALNAHGYYGSHIAYPVQL